MPCSRTGLSPRRTRSARPAFPTGPRNRPTPSTDPPPGGLASRPPAPFSLRSPGLKFERKKAIFSLLQTPSFTRHSHDIHKTTPSQRHVHVRSTSPKRQVNVIEAPGQHGRGTARTPRAPSMARLRRNGAIHGAVAAPSGRRGIGAGSARPCGRAEPAPRAPVRALNSRGRARAESNPELRSTGRWRRRHRPCLVRNGRAGAPDCR